MFNNERYEPSMDEIITLSKQRGFVFQGSEIYGGLAGTWDYGPLGTELKNNLKNSWWRAFVRKRPEIVGIDSAILMSGDVWKASGHVDGFHDPLVEDIVTKKRFRADHLLEDNGVSDADGMPVEQMTSLIREKQIKSPEGNELGDVKQFNMMFSTRIGASEESSAVTYLRPETAQGIFVNIKNVIDTVRPKLPFGIAQIGKAFRNEITPRDFIFRVREMEQMEIEYLIHPSSDWEATFGALLDDMKRWLRSVGIDSSLVHEYIQPPEGRAHYSIKTVDLEFDYPFGRKELWGFANRTDYDLKAHQNSSKTSLEYYNQETNEKVLPHVLEPSIGLDRLFLAVLVSAYRKEYIKNEDGKDEERIVLGFKPHIAPVTIAILPLMKKDGLSEIGMDLYSELSGDFSVQFDTSGSIGKRYRRQDEIGTPWCITIDYQTKEDNSVTIRERDSLKQFRINKDEIESYIRNAMKDTY